eukprot:TRINITY_DN20177_c0_g1_i1.p2 TRINITY_DN20177_c0_g1~~TRINITY_DN20177_c0_g1_i1.p2  ORF type:complete len:243 (-),score=-5.51 TRINITY_DN20177_c0_g1_i1:814-1542(-)
MICNRQNQYGYGRCPHTKLLKSQKQLKIKTNSALFSCLQIYENFFILYRTYQFYYFIIKDLCVFLPPLKCTNNHHAICLLYNIIFFFFDYTIIQFNQNNQKILLIKPTQNYILQLIPGVTQYNYSFALKFRQESYSKQPRQQRHLSNKKENSNIIPEILQQFYYSAKKYIQPTESKKQQMWLKKNSYHKILTKILLEMKKKCKIKQNIEQNAKQTQLKSETATPHNIHKKQINTQSRLNFFH